MSLRAEQISAKVLESRRRGVDLVANWKREMAEGDSLTNFLSMLDAVGGGVEVREFWVNYAHRDVERAIDLYSVAFATEFALVCRPTGSRQEELRMLGKWGWDHTCRIRQGDDAFLIEAVDRLGGAGFLDHLTSQGDYTSEVALPTKWIDSGSLTLTSSHTFFSAMACTSIAASICDEWRLPAESFLVKVPEGLLRTSSGVDYGWILFSVLRNVYAAGKFYEEMADLRLLAEPSGAAMDLTFCKLGTGAVRFVLFNDPIESQLSSEESRLIASARRAVVGLLHTIQFTANFKDRSITGKTQRGRSGPPPHREIVVGRPLAINCRETLREYHRGGGAAPTVQSLVRGHYKRQPCGAQQQDRRVIWIEPHWRGPIEAPILVHDRVI